MAHFRHGAFQAGSLAKRCVRADVHQQTNTGTETSRYRDIHAKKRTDKRSKRTLATTSMTKQRDAETETQ